MAQKINVSLVPAGIQISVEKGTPFIDILHEYGVEFPCGGKGTCGRCRIKILEGQLEADKEQRSRLEQLKLPRNWRLACSSKADTDVTVEVFQFVEIILADNSEFHFIPEEGYGLAVDAGTTTLVVQLLDLLNGKVLDVATAMNPQVKFGADLISRIQSGLEGRQEEMKKLIHKKLGEMIDSILDRHQVKIRKVVIVGNTAMHHIFSGLNLQPLSHYPFESPGMGIQHFTPRELGWRLCEQSIIRFYPCIGSFVGSDILAGIAATGMADRKEYSILIDLGTNGEIVLGNCDRIICASTAAGPAFEGAKISQGMRAVSGAVSSVHPGENQFNCHVIGNRQPTGICGSGLVDAIAVFREMDLIDLFGDINSGEERIMLTSGIYITQQDIREFQLAKAAVAAGLQILLNRFDMTFNYVDRIFIAGGFGNFLNLQNVVKTGLIESDIGKIVKMGNTALLGAKMFLFSNEHLISSIINRTTHLSLEADPTFQDIFIEKLML